MHLREHSNFKVFVAKKRAWWKQSDIQPQTGGIIVEFANLSQVEAEASEWRPFQEEEDENEVRNSQEAGTIGFQGGSIDVEKRDPATAWIRRHPLELHYEWYDVTDFTYEIQNLVIVQLYFGFLQNHVHIAIKHILIYYTEICDRFQN